MKEYPSIPYGAQNRTVYVFKKLDGSNIRVEWARGRGFWKYGSRTRLIDETDLQFGDAVRQFWLESEKYHDMLHNFTDFKKAILFFEYWGENSAYGNHVKDEPHYFTLIDIAADKKGLLLPKDFLRIENAAINSSWLLAHEKWNHEKTQQVWRGEYPGQSFEGVVCKANEYESPGRPVMFKVKSAAWLKKLKDNGGTEE